MATTELNISYDMNDLSMNNNSHITDEDIIITIRHDDVIERIQAFVSRHKLIPQVTSDIFRMICRDHWSSAGPINPASLLFDVKRVDMLLNNLDISQIPAMK